MKIRFVRGAETRLRIIRTAADLFHQQGARATSPDEIIEASRTGKGQFYHYFKSKEGLVHEVLQTYLAEIKAGSSQVNYEINSWRDLEKWFPSSSRKKRREGWLGKPARRRWLTFASPPSKGPCSWEK